MIRIIAKPSIEHAIECAKKHEIDGLEYLRMSGLGDWVIFDLIDNEQNRVNVINWFIASPNEPPFPPGTCLFYNW
ncbi:MAG: hypothetical protein ACXACR_14625 [Candidatus Hodarchaeales archaeon]|jgi:hypothetical protein